MMFDAVFISDLHLHPKNNEIKQKFWDFVAWAKDHTKSVYILGDFFHAWAGDDDLDTFSLEVMNQLRTMHEHGIALYFMVGNRDFLLGELFFKKTCMTLLPDPSLIQLDGERVFLTHGDRYCSKDKLHQVMIALTRNQTFKNIFSKWSLKFRRRLVHGIRTFSQSRKKGIVRQSFQLIESHLCRDMKKLFVNTAIYGHVHQPEKKVHVYQHVTYTQYVLSDWDKDVTIVCYNKESGLSLYNFFKGV